MEKDGKEVLKLDHYNIINWPDNKAPLPDTVDYIVDLATKCARHIQTSYRNYKSGKTSNPEKFLVHCYQGVGRTGVMISLVNILITIFE